MESHNSYAMQILMNILQGMSRPWASVGTCLPFGVMSCSREKEYKEKKEKLWQKISGHQHASCPGTCIPWSVVMQSNHNHPSPPRSDMHHCYWEACRETQVQRNSGKRNLHVT
jgi:hypothetical protein